MGKLTELLKLAQQRSSAMELPYKGALTPLEAYTVLQLAPGAKIVDVRTHAEWDWVGHVKDAVEIEWMRYPELDTNPNFVAQLTRQVDKEALVMFICRSGQRSNYAAIAATEAGFGDCYNILEGFEGDRDANDHRGKLGGWRMAGLPWYQG